MVPHPPRLASWLLSVFLRGDAGTAFHGDLDERFREEVRRSGPTPARFWYWRRTCSVLLWELREGWAHGMRVAAHVCTALLPPWIDVKLGGRMLVRYPSLALVGTLAMTVAIGLGAAWMEVVNDLVHPALPLDEGEQVIGIRIEDTAESREEPRALSDFVRWRGSLETIQDLGTFRSIDRNVIPASGIAAPVEGAEITASAFRLTRVPAELGRTLIEEDERDESGDVVVLGYQLWQTSFHGDPGVLGGAVQVGSATYTIVGVMPEGFAFPLGHQFWIPLRADELLARTSGPRQGPAIRIFGRLAPGVTLAGAQAELTALGARAAADMPRTHRYLRNRVIPYTHLFVGGGGEALYRAEIVFVMILVLICLNVAVLFFARNASRQSEIALRTALGASRRRILFQLFVEALVMAALAGSLALLAVRWSTAEVMRVLWPAVLGATPFWWDEGLAPQTFFWTGILVVAAAAILGVLPALRATGSDLRTRISAAGTGHTRPLGGLWTTALVVQVAFAVAILPTAMAAVKTWIETESASLGFPAEEYLAARIDSDASRDLWSGGGLGAMSIQGFQQDLLELERRLESMPEVTGVTFANRLPGMSHPIGRVEVEGHSAPRATDPNEEDDLAVQVPRGLEVRSASVADDFFDELSATLISGRTFHSADRAAMGKVVIVNRAFARDLLQDRNAVGRRLRYVDERGEPSEWFEIVGVVEDLATHGQGLNPGKPPAVYHPLDSASLADGERWSARVAVRVRGEPETLAPDLRRLAADVDPDLRLHELARLDHPPARTQWVQLMNEIIVWAAASIALLALLVSASGTYAMMSFTVARRTREIGILAALGAVPRRIAITIFGRASKQIGIGVIVGMGLWVVQVIALRAAADSGVADDSGMSWGDTVYLISVVGLMTLAGLLACGPPVRRALRVQPTEALKQE